MSIPYTIEERVGLNPSSKTAHTLLVQKFEDGVMGRVFREGFWAMTPNGILGDARGATAEMGETCIANAADGIVAALEA